MATPLIKNDEMGQIISNATRDIERAGGAVSALVLSGNRFEHWWKCSMLQHFAGEEWGRLPGYSVGEGAGVAIEHPWAVQDFRHAYPRRTGKGEKRIDLVVRRAASGVQSHLVEMKLVDGTKNQGLSDLGSLRDDVVALRAVSVWDEVASAWAIALAYGFEDDEARTASLDKASKIDGLGMPLSYAIAPHHRAAGPLRVLAWRVA